MASYAYTFTSGDTVTPTKLNNARTVSDIVNADIKSDAAIAGTKIAPAFGAQDITVSTANRSITNTGNFALSFGTNNTTRVTIPAAGGISIATGSPDRIGADFSNNAISTLNFGGPNSGEGNFQLQYDRTGGTFRILGGNTGSQAERMRIDASGNVGIGTTSPNDRLVLAAGSGSVYMAANNGTTNCLYGVSAGNVGLTGTTSNHAFLLYSNNTERMRIDASGNVGIGTSSPGGSTKLNVAGRALFTGGEFDPFDSTASGVSISYDTSNNIGVISAVQTGVAERQLNIRGQSLHLFAGSTERMRIDASGNVGIGGTANAAAILDAASTTKGFLPPRMTTAQRDAISTPPAGLVIYNTTTNKLNVRTASSWEAVTSS